MSGDMSECMRILRECVEGFKAGRLSREEFGGRVLETLSENLDTEFSEKDRTIILNLLDKMREQEIAQPDVCGELAEHFSQRVSPEPEPEPEPEPKFRFESSSTAPGPQVQGPQPAGTPYQHIPPHLLHPEQLIRTMRSLTAWYTWLMAIGAPLCLVPVVGALGNLLVVAAMILGSILLFAAWHVIQGESSRMTPLKAVGLHFIPLFNIYWYFPSFLGLTQDMRDFLQARNSGITPPDSRLALLFCLLMVLPVLITVLVLYVILTDPSIQSLQDVEVLMNEKSMLDISLWVGSLLASAGYVVSIFMFKEITRASEEILRSWPSIPRPRFSTLGFLYGGAFGLTILLSVVLAFIIGLMAGTASM